MTKSFVAKLGAVSALAIAISSIGTGAALADPSTTGRTYQAAGSDTIQDLYNGLTNGYAKGSTNVAAAAPSIGSWNAFGPNGEQDSTITPKAGGATFDRPSGSGQGVNALSASWQPGANSYTGNSKTPVGLQVHGLHEIDIARSSSGVSSDYVATAGSADDNLTYLPLGRDGVSAAFNGTGITDLSTADLTFIFNKATQSQSSSADGRITRDTTSTSADPVYVADDGTKIQLHPVLPQSSSGTRSFFLKAIGVTDIGDWVEQGVNENSASALDETGDIAPFSAAQWIAQKNGVGADTFTAGTSSLQLLSLNGKAPFADGSTAPNLKPGALFGSASTVPASGVGTFSRDVYSVVPTARLASDSAFNKVVTGLAKQTSVIEDFGFLPVTYSGTTGQQHSKWTQTGSVPVAGPVAAKVSPKLTVSAKAASYGRASSFAVTVKRGTANATGTVTATYGKTVVKKTLASGKATLSLPKTLLKAGKRTVAIKYAGNTTTNAASKSVAITVAKAPTKTAISLNHKSAKVKKTKVKATIKVTVPNTSLKATGKVTVKVGTKTVKTVTLKAANKGKVTVTLPKFTKTGSRTKVTAKYAGATNLKASTKTATVKVTKK